MSKNENQPDIDINNNAKDKKNDLVKKYAVAALIATVAVILLRTICLMWFYDMDIGYHSKGFATTLFNVFCVLSTLFFASAVFVIKPDTPCGDGNGKCLFIKIASAAALLAFAAYFSLSVFSTSLVASTTLPDLLSKITALMGIVYFAISVFCPNANKNIRTMLGFGIIIWCVYALSVTYFDIYVQLNSPDKIILHLAFIAIMIFIVSELRCFVIQVKKGFYLFSACAATFFCGLASIPSFIFGLSIGEMNKYFIYDVVIFAVGIYSAARLISFAFSQKACIELSSIESEDNETPDESFASEGENEK